MTITNRTITIERGPDTISLRLDANSNALPISITVSQHDVETEVWFDLVDAETVLEELTRIIDLAKGARHQRELSANR